MMGKCCRPPKASLERPSRKKKERKKKKRLIFKIFKYIEMKSMNIQLGRDGNFHPIIVKMVNSLKDYHRIQIVNYAN